MTQRAVVILDVVVVGLLLALASLTTKKARSLSQVTPASAQEVQKQGETPSPSTERILEAGAAAELQRLQHANQQLEEYIQYLLEAHRSAETGRGRDAGRPEGVGGSTHKRTTGTANPYGP
jgi:hypothetical protein